ncbi:MAG: hypothetical protein FD126_1026 [Elusimicrobia bacterium]|nr:MAG: hypothetical protein FD126_1026 [Elusimicrobiota bacterium]
MVEPVLEAWTKAWDAYLETLGKAAEGTLTSPEFLRFQRRSLDLLCGHRDLMMKAAGELSAAKPVKQARKAVRGKRR